MKVRLKLLNKKAVMPKRAHSTDAGYDMIATSRYFDDIGNLVYGTGVAVEIPEGYVGLLFPRSSISKYDLTLTNCIGVIDSGYRGEIMCKFKPTLIYCDNIKIDSYYQHGTIQTDPDTQSVSARGLDSTFFGSKPTNSTGRAMQHIRRYNPDTKQVDDIDLETVPPKLYEVGDKIAQLIIIPIPDVEFKVVETLTDSDRGQGGYGSTGQ